MATATRRKSSASKAKDWDKVQALVKPAMPRLTAMSSYSELRQWAVDNDLNTSTLFPIFKRELKKRGIDYETMRAEAMQAAADELAAAATEAPELTLWIYTDAEHHVYAVCSEDGEQAWYGEFFDDDPIYRGDGDQLRADQSALSSAVFLAGQARLEVDASAVRLTVRTSNHELTADRVTGSALKHRVALTVDVSDGNNPATEWVNEPGFGAWRDINLEKLFADTAE